MIEPQLFAGGDSSPSQHHSVDLTIPVELFQAVSSGQLFINL